MIFNYKPMDSKVFESMLLELDNYINKGIISENASDAAYELCKPNIELTYTNGTRAPKALIIFIEIQSERMLLSTYMRLVDFILEFPRITIRKFDFNISFGGGVQLSNDQKEQVKKRIINGLYDAIDDYANEKHLDIELVRDNILIQ